MSIPLRQSTAVTVDVGPFLDRTNAADRETGLTIAAADVLISKNNGAFAAKSDTGAGTHDTRGWYNIPLNATDTNTIGRLVIDIENAGALPAGAEFWVYQANVYDALFAGLEYLEVCGIEQRFVVVGANVNHYMRDNSTIQGTRPVATTPGADPVTGIG